MPDRYNVRYVANWHPCSNGRRWAVSSQGPAAAICSCQRLPQLAVTLTEERKLLA
jgi:uncharacterized membrane protein